MAIIYTYPSASPSLEDKLLMSDATNNNNTKNLRLGDLKNFLEENFNLVEEVRNNSGSDIEKGQPLHITGVVGTTPAVEVADASDPTKMPVSGLAAEDIGNNSNGLMIINGILDGIDTANIDGTVDPASTIYVNSTTGGSIDYLTATRPATEANLVQNVAIVIKDNPGAAGRLQVTCIGRTNDTPNLDYGKIFIGDENGLPIASKVPYDIFKQVCTPIANAATGGDAMPNNAGGVNWFYQNPVLNKWTFTANNPELKQVNICDATTVNVEISIGAGTDVGNNIEWSLRLYQPGTANYYQVIASTGEPGPNNIGQPIVSNGPTTSGSNFTACNVQARISTIDLKTNFFDLYGGTGELELWIRNQGTGGSIISSCGVSFYG